jgi:murein endopeptidase
MGHPDVLDHERRADGPEIVAWLSKLKRAQSAGSKGVSIADIAQLSDGAFPWHLSPRIGIIEDTIHLPYCADSSAADVPCV